MIRRRMVWAGLTVLPVLCCWLLPNHYYPWPTFYNEFAAFTALWTAACCVLAHRRFDLSWSILILFCLTIVPLIQWLSGLIVFRGDALLATFYLAGAAFAISVGRGGYSIGGKKAFEFLAWLFVFGAAMSVWIALYQWLRLGGNIWIADLRVGDRPYANLAQPNNLATFLSMGLASALYLWESRCLGRVAAHTIVVFLMVGVVLTQSRTPWLGWLCFAVWWGWNSERCGLRLPRKWVATWVALYFGMVLSLPHVANFLHLSVSDIAERAQSSGRLDLWVQFCHAILQGGWWGYGWNQVSMAQIAVTLDHPVPISAEHSHNILLDLLLWNGPLVGGLIIAAMAYWLGRLALRANSLQSAFGLLVVGLLLLHGMLEFPLEYAFFLLPTCLLLGMVERHQGIKPIAILPRKIGIATVALAAGLIGWVWHDYRLIEDDHRLMRFETARIGTIKAEKSAPDVLLLDQLREFLRFVRTEASVGMSEDELAWMRDVAGRYPYPPSLFRYALALGLNSRYEESARQLRILKALYKPIYSNAPRHYDEAIQAIRALSEKYPQLNNVLSLLANG